MSGRQGRPTTQRRDRRDERRRTTDDEDTVLDSQDVSSIDRGNNNIYRLTLRIYIYTHTRTHIHTSIVQPYNRFVLKIATLCVRVLQD